MQPGETVAAKWVSLQEMDAMIDRGEIAPPDIDRVRQMHAAFEEYCSKK